MNKIIILFALLSITLYSNAQKCKFEYEDGDLKQNKLQKMGSSKGFSVKLAVGREGSGGNEHYLVMDISRTGAYFTMEKGKELIVELENGDNVKLNAKTREVGRKSGINYSLKISYDISDDLLVVLKSAPLKKLTIHTDNGYFYLEGGKNANFLIDHLKCLE